MPLLNKIVVCDDEDSVAFLVNLVLGDSGFLCLRARDGQQAIFLASAELPDLLILDVMMPKLDGIAACRQLKADPVLARIPILMLTSLAATDDKVRGLEAGADDYLAKPFDVRELVARVRALIRANRRARETSPVTGLPGAAALEAAVEARLADNAPFAVLHCALEGYDHFVEAHGWKRGEELVAAVGRALLSAAGSAGRSGATVVTHLGGDDFGLVTAAAPESELPAALGAAADEAAKSLGGGVRLVVAQVDGAAGQSVDGVARALAQARRADARDPND